MQRPETLHAAQDAHALLMEALGDAAEEHIPSEETRANIQTYALASIALTLNNVPISVDVTGCVCVS